MNFQNNQWRGNFFSLVIKSLFLCVTLIGTTVLYGWFMRLEHFIQINEKFVPMQFNTALCFLLIGLSGLLINNKNKYVSMTLSILALLLAFATLLQNILNINFGIDQLFIHHYITTLSSAPGRMAPNTSICFILSALYIINYKIELHPIRQGRAALAFAFMIFLLCIISLCGYIADIPSAYSWRDLTAMAVHTASAFLLLSIAFFLYISKKFKLVRIFRLSFLTLIIGMIGTVISWQYTKATLSETLKDELVSVGNAVIYKINSKLDYNQTELLRLFTRISANTYSSNQFIKSDITDYFKDIESLESISYSMQHQGIKKDILLTRDNLEIEKILAKKCIAAKSSLLKNNNQYYVCIKSLDNKHASVLNLKTIIKLAINNSNRKNLKIKIIENKNTLVNIGGLDSNLAPVKLKINFWGHSFLLYLQAREEYSYDKIFKITDLYLFISLLLLTLLTLSLLFWEVSRERLKDLIINNEKKSKVEENFRLVVESSPATTFIIDEKGKINFATMQAKRLLGYEVTELIGMSVENLIDPSLKESHILNRIHYFLNPIAKDMAQKRELHIVTKDNIKIPVEVTLTPITMDDKILVLCLITDITIQKKLAREKKYSSNISLIHECNRKANESETFDIFLRKSLEIICKRAHWDIGHIYMYNDLSNDLVSSKIWFHDSNLNISAFKTLTEKTTFKKNIGLPGDVWANSKTVSIADVHKSKNFPRVKDPACQDIHGALAFPVMLNNTIYCVLEFFSYQIKELEADDIQTFNLISNQVSQVFERREYQEKILKHEKQNSLLLKSAGEGIYGLNLKGEVSFINKAATRMLGYKKEELLNINMHSKIHYKLIDGSKHDETISPTHRTLTDGKIRRVKHSVLWKKDGSQLMVDYIVSPVILDKQITGVVIIFNDISEKIIADNKLHEYAKKLEDSNRELNNFAYVASHDLKEPLRGINNYSKILLEDYGDKLDEDGHQELQTLVKLSERMTSLISSLLEYSRVGTVDIAYRESNIQTIISDKIELLEVYIKENNAAITIANDLPIIVCDRVRLGEVFYNLIVNAIKYNLSTDKKLSISWTENKNEYVFSMKDNGIGIKKEDIPKIFKIFQRLHARDDFGGGTGVGMAIVDKIIKRHKGRVWIEPNAEQGITVLFSISKALKAP